MQFREPAAQNWTSTQLQNRGAVATGLVASHSSDVKSSHFAVEWSRDLDPVATAPRFCS